MRTEETEYRLREIATGKFVTTEIRSNESSDFCSDTQFVLSTDSNSPTWLGNSAEHAEWVRHNNSPWYNAGYDTPSNYYSPEELETVVVKIVTDVEENKVDIHLPTRLDIYTAKLSRDKGYTRIIEEYLEVCEKQGTDKSTDYSYDYHDFTSYRLILEKLNK